MTRHVRRALVMFLVAAAVPAFAQAQGPLPPVSVPPEPTVTFGYVGADTGPAVVEKFGPIVGFEGGIRLFNNFDAVAEVTWTRDVSTNRQHELVEKLATELGRTQGAQATGDIVVGQIYGGLGLRYVFEQQSRFRPYVIVTVGASRINMKPTLTLGGTDVTETVNQFGVTLGQDVIGNYIVATVDGGAGMIMVHGEFYLDMGIRMAQINEASQRANAARLVFGGGYRF